MKETILVTGGTGFIGSHTTVELQQAGYEVVIIDNLSNSNASVIDGIEKITGIRPAFEKVDLNDFEATESVESSRRICGKTIALLSQQSQLAHERVGTHDQI